jgi:2-polyprenyl-3-methyl-5-hydroxy-6-metoxy-1,4-benzoquinol methylase
MSQQAVAPTASPSPDLIFTTLNAYQRTAALRGAIELDLFTALSEGNNTPDALAGRCQASERGMRILCDFLVICGLLTKEGGRYELTPDTALFLNRHSPAYLGESVKFLNSEMLMNNFQDVAAIVRKGGTQNDQGTMEPEHPIWVEFARSMAPMMAPAAEAIAELIDARSGPEWQVLDIAAGHGLFGINIAAKNPKAKVVAVDWPSVLALSEENARKAGVADRFHKLPGSAFEVEFGSGYDVVLLTNFLHHFDPATCRQLLEKVHRSLNAGGRAVTLEFIPNEDRVTPPPAAAFSMMMLGSTAAGDAYTFSELDQMFRNAGFSRNELYPLPAGPQQVVISYK